MNNSIAFTGNNQNQGRPSLLGAVGSAFLNVGMTAGAGAAAGGVVGKAVSLVPVKVSAGALERQYEDMFIKAARNTDGLPEYLKDKGDDIANVVKKGATALKGYVSAENQATKVVGFAQGLAAISETALKEPETQNVIKEFFKDSAIPKDGYTRESVAERLSEWHKAIVEKAQATSGTLDDAGKEFIEKAKNIKGLNEIAESGAKHLRKTTIIGAGVGIGILAALTLNLLKTYGVIGNRASKNQNAKAQAPQGFSKQA